MMMNATPREVYRRIDFDARVEASDPAQLVALCYEQLIGALGTAVFAHDRRDSALRSQSLTRALSATIALRLGVSGDTPVADALHQMYEAAGRTVLDSVLECDAAALNRLRQDFLELQSSLFPPSGGAPIWSNGAILDTSPHSS